MLINGLLLLGEAAVYFGLMALLFRLRNRFGIGLFMCVLGVMHFLETYLASVFYVALPFGVVSPGSTVLFSGKLIMLLLLYIKEDARIARQPIYGLLLGNALMIALGLLLRLHGLVDLPGGNKPDIAFIDEMGWLMVAGTTLLYVDAIALILLYERLGRRLRKHMFARVAIVACLVLSFDQLAFFMVLHFVAGAPFSALIGGWVAKMIAAGVYSAALVLYLRHFENTATQWPRGLADVFEVLTYREKYEALVEHASRDGLTGLMHRGRFEELARQAVEAGAKKRRQMSLLIVDVDHFKSINDRFGHAEGDRILKSIADMLRTTADAENQVFRIGGEEFAVVSPLPYVMARLLGEQIRQATLALKPRWGLEVTVSIGLASTSSSITTLAELFSAADACLYAAKAAGRNRLVGQHERRPDAEAADPEARAS